ncbi:TPA: hypothetical protein N0F65_011301 [Lagenidium giganteum]|uniref:Secreted protein n=1 Tax=Lagenidium giganteum TaxID=4803 RepID=A0AAV2YQY3_9STRA|nr:TPA: hypothetical protein N0F65_011301 [Lagenidium giganteum]
MRWVIFAFAMVSLRSLAPLGFVVLGTTTLMASSMVEIQDPNQEKAYSTVATPLSACGLCQQTGECAHAFHGSFRQFCHTLARWVGHAVLLCGRCTVRCEYAQLSL